LGWFVLGRGTKIFGLGWVGVETQKPKLILVFIKHCAFYVLDAQVKCTLRLIVSFISQSLFNKEKEDPVLFKPGDEVEFYSISEDEYSNY